MANVMVIVAVTLLAFAVLAEGKRGPPKLVFERTPKKIYELERTPLLLHCSVTLSNTKTKLKSMVIKMEADVGNLAEMSETEKKPAKKLDPEALSVKGDYHSTKKEMTLTYEVPAEHLGKYVCLVTLVQGKHSLDQKSTLNVKFEYNDIGPSKMVEFVKTLDGRQRLMVQQNDNQEQRILENTKKFEKQKTEFAKYKYDTTNQLNNLINQAKPLITEIRSVNSRLTPVANIVAARREVRKSQCYWTGWQNKLDGWFRFDVDNYVICGMKSHHNNKFEDRQFGFYICKLYTSV